MRDYPKRVCEWVEQLATPEAKTACIFALLTLLGYGCLVVGILLYSSQKGEVGMFLLALMIVPAVYLLTRRMELLTETHQHQEPRQESCPWKDRHHDH
jgi:hypothetical protein